MSDRPEYEKCAMPTASAMADATSAELPPILPRDMGESLWLDILDLAYREAMRRVRNQRDAEEIAAEAIERLLMVQQPIHPHAFINYVRRIVRNLVIDAHRRESADMRNGGDLLCGPDEYADLEQAGECLNREADPAEHLLASEQERERAQLCESMLSTLSPRHRRLVELHLAGHSHAAIAAELGMASAAVSKQTLHRICKRLSETFAKYRHLLVA